MQIERHFVKKGKTFFIPELVSEKIFSAKEDNVQIAHAQCRARPNRNVLQCSYLYDVSKRKFNELLPIL